MTADNVLLVLRFVRFGAAILLWGTGAYLIFIAPAGLSERLRARLHWLPLFGGVVLIVVTLLRLPLLAASFGDGWPDAVSPDVLAAVLQTWTGYAWIIDTAICLFIAASGIAGRLNWPATAGLAGLLLAASAMTGHAVIGPAGWSLFHQLNDVIHLEAAGFWLGALPALAMTLRRESAGPEALRAVRRFGLVGQPAVALVLATGITNAILIKGGVSLHWSSAYDVLLLAKVAVVLGMIGLACLNRFGYLPRMAAGSNGAAQAMRRAALLEIALGATAVGLVTVFGMIDTA